MSNVTEQSDRRPTGRTPERRRWLAAARRLFVQNGPDVTLTEVAVEAGIAAGSSDCAGLAESFRAQRLGDLIDLVRSLQEPETERVATAVQPDAGWAERVREILFTYLDRPGLALQDVARTLAVSPRTLQRRLADEGTSWRGELDAVRRARATALLRGGATRDATAERVGYSGSRALRRALGRWSLRSQLVGFSPAPVRECGAG
jgi:AraC-like DNA-binding protein